MSTTTIRMEDELKARVASAAQRAGKTPHAFMVDAITQTVEQSEQDRQFQLLAEQRWTTLLEDGLAIEWDDAKAWLLARADGEDVPPPTPRRISL